MKKFFTLAVLALLPLLASAQTIQEPESVDLGLSVKWSSFNLGATKAEETGTYFAWGEISGKETYSWNNYGLGDGKDFSKYSADDHLTTLDADDDAATKLLGKKWRMPTKAEYEELWKKCTWKVETVNNVKGTTVTGSNGNSIFFPFTGWFDSKAARVGKAGYVWTKDLSNKTDLSKAFSFKFIEDTENPGALVFGFNYDSRFYGYIVRPVYDENGTTGIKQVDADQVKTAPIYTLSGMKIGKGKIKPGVYVQKGHKFVVK